MVSVRSPVTPKSLSQEAKTKLKKKKAGLSHLLTSKSRKRKRHLRRGATLHAADEARVMRMLGR